MDFNISQHIAELFSAGGLGAGGWAFWQVKENKKDVEKMEAAIKTLAENQKSLEILVATNYTREELNTRFDKIDTVLMRIEDKLDKKADK